MEPAARGAASRLNRNEAQAGLLAIFQPLARIRDRIMIRKAFNVLMDAIGMFLFLALAVWSMTDGLARLIEWLI